MEGPTDKHFAQALILLDKHIAKAIKLEIVAVVAGLLARIEVDQDELVRVKAELVDERKALEELHQSWRTLDRKYNALITRNATAGAPEWPR